MRVVCALSLPLFLPCAAMAGLASFEQRVDVSVAMQPGAITSADFNRDGRADIAVLHREPPAISILLNRAVSQEGPLRTAHLTARRAPH